MLHADLLGERARLTPDHPALVVVEPELRLSYRELDQRAVRCARVWTEVLGLEPGDRVGILAHNRVEFLEAFFAAAKTGIVLVPLSTRSTAHELAFVVEHSGMRVVMWDGELVEVVRGLREIVEPLLLVALDDPGTTGEPGYAALCAALPERSWVSLRCAPEDLLCLLYTSGTTGKPKGVMIPHRMVAWNAYNTVCSWQLRADDVSPVFTPLYHAGGLFAFLTPLFAIGGTVVLHRRFEAGEVWRAIERERCTVVLGVPTIWKALLESEELERVDLGHVRWFISGGAPLPVYLIEAYQERGIGFKQGFGMTEVGVNCFAMTLEQSRRKIGSIGTPMMFTEVRLVDADGVEVPTGEVGELCFRGPHVSVGYWQAPDLTANAIDMDGWFHSGDLARCDDEGFYFIAGRQKDMIISGGVNIYPAEIEGVLVQHPAVAEAAVVAIPDAHWGEVGVAFVIAQGPAPTADELLVFLGARLARYKLPRAFRIVADFPRTAIGKVIKGALRDRYVSEEPVS